MKLPPGQWRRQRYRNTPTGLNALGLAPAAVLSAAVEDVYVGDLLNLTQGSTPSLFDSAGNRFKIVAGAIYTGPTATSFAVATEHEVIVEEYHPAAPGPPRQTTLAISVLDAPPAFPYTLQIVNPSFETGDLTGWSVYPEGGNAPQVWPAAGGPGITGSQDGDYHLGGGTTTPTYIYQQFPLPSALWAAIDTGAKVLQGFAAWHRTFAPQTDNGRIYAAFHDADGDIISYHTNAHTHPDAWTREELSATFIPAGTRDIRLNAQSVRVTGTNNDNYWDAFESPEIV